MSARRQSSSTSLTARYGQQTEAELAQRQHEYCNAFWGVNDEGVERLLMRMRDAARTTDELRSFWKERAAIEEDYAKRLASLGKRQIAVNETGELAVSFSTLVAETAQQGSTHLELSSTIRRVLEAQTAEFVARQTQHRKTVQAHIEKQFKAKQTQRSMVDKARDKYEQNCIVINSYTAQSTLVQGREYDKLQLKLDRARQSIATNEQEYQTLTRALHDTCAKWEKEWKQFCDQCQDLEEERIDFTKNNLWAFANAVSTACVADDESCEHLRIALEGVDTPVEQETFIRGMLEAAKRNGIELCEIADPPPIVNYKAEGDAAVPQQTKRIACYARSSARPPQPMYPPEDEGPPVNQAGIGAGGGQAAASGQEPRTSRSRANSRARSALMEASAVSEALRNGAPSSVSHAAGIQSGGGSTPSSGPPPQLPPIAPSAPLTGPGTVGDAADPLARTLENLRSAASNPRRSSVHVGSSQQQEAVRSPSRQSRRGTVESSSRGGAGLGIDYSAAANAIVGSHPSSRPSSPAPTANFMKPPNVRASPVPVEEVLGSYQQHFPGEHAHRRALSRQGSVSRQSTAGAEIENRGRPVSREGHAGIGANGRGGSLSPAPPAVRRMSVHQQGPPQQQQRAPSPMRAPSQQQQQQRAPSPMRAPQQQRSPSPMHPQLSGSSRAPLGISLDPQGRVTEDAMAERYAAQRTGSYHQQQGSYPTAGQPYGAGYGQPVGYTAATPVPSGYSATPAPSAYSSAMPAPSGYSSAGSATTSFAQASQSPGYNQQAYRGPPTQPPPVGMPPPTPAQFYQQQYQQQQQQQQQQPRQSNGYPSAAGAQNGWQSPPQHQQQASGYQQQAPPPVNGYATPGPGPSSSQPSGSFQGLPSQTPAPQQQREPSPTPAPAVPPTGQYLEDGKGVLFYVKALYDYTATIDEEFDFQANDVIAVTETPEDGWWSGYLLDDARRVPGRHVFPSNFVCLF